MEFKIKLLEKREEALNTKTFTFSRPKGFDYIAGQYVYLTLPYLLFPDDRGDTRQFTLSSSPTEKNLSITVRMRQTSGFKRSIEQSPVGTTISMHGPNGDFILENRASTFKVEPQIFIAGGIGVTPFRSIVRYVTDKHINVPITLLCSNSTPEEIPFKKELDEIVKQNKNIKVIHTITKPENSRVKWKGLIGRISVEFLKKHILNSKYNILHTSFFLCGPPKMVSAMEETLDKIGIDESRVHVEKFTGY
ncbi:MAG: FAD-dependent oxidoreductase [Patescibacteria group bacterium]